MYCEICGSDKVEKKIKVKTFEYKGHFLTIDDYSYFTCGSCEEDFVDEQYFKTIEHRIREFQKSVDGLLTCKEIVTIRTSYGFTQEKFGELLGGGKKAFARYENGIITQSKPMDNLLRIISANPSALDTLIKKNFRVVSCEPFLYLGNEQENEYCAVPPCCIKVG